MSMSQPRCHKNPSAGFSSTALLYASGHSCPYASPFMTGFVSQPPAASTGIVSSWVQPPHSMHTGMCPAGYTSTLGQELASFCRYYLSIHVSRLFMTLSWIFSWICWYVCASLKVEQECLEGFPSLGLLSLIDNIRVLLVLTSWLIVLAPVVLPIS